MKMYRLAPVVFLGLVLAGCGGGGSGGGQQAGAITGRAVNGSGQPVPGAAVSLFPSGRSHQDPLHSTTTNVEGEFTLENVAAGTYTLAIEAEGPGGLDINVQVSVTVPAGSTVNLVVRVSTTGGGVVPGPGTGAISGIVLDDDGRPLAGMRVKAEREPGGPELVTATNSEGRFFFDDLTPGLWKVWADPTGSDRSDFVWIEVDADHEVQTTIDFD